MKLESNQVHLYFSYPGQITDTALLCRYQALLTADESEQMSRFSFAGHRHQYLLTRALVRACLSRYHAVEPGEWRFEKNAYGKPQVRHPDSGNSTCFNLSHTRGLVVCAIAPVAIGVDVEDSQRTTQAAFESLASYFSEAEIGDIASLPENRKKQRFFDYWTLKEAYIKARGMGLALPLGKFSFHFEDETLSGFKVQPEIGDDARNWQFWRISMSSHYRMAIALNTPERDFEISTFNTVPLVSYDPVPLNFL